RHHALAERLVAALAPARCQRAPDAPRRADNGADDAIEQPHDDREDESRHDQQADRGLQPISEPFDGHLAGVARQPVGGKNGGGGEDRKDDGAAHAQPPAMPVKRRDTSAPSRFSACSAATRASASARQPAAASAAAPSRASSSARAPARSPPFSFTSARAATAVRARSEQR